MFRTFGKLLIGRSVDREAPLPRWLRRWADRDPELARFDAAARRLNTLLHRDAAEWTTRFAGDVGAEHSTPAGARAVGLRRSRERRPAVWAGAACAVAASVMVALVWWHGLRGDVPLPATSGGGELAVHRDAPLISPIERAELMALWRAGRSDVVAWHARLKVAAVDGFGSIELRGPATTFPSFTVSGDAPRRVQEAFAATVALQRQDLTTEVRSAYKFFAHRLPASFAILVGLQNG